MNRHFFCLFFATLLSLCARAQETDIAAFRTWAPTPPMGWNSWDCYYSTVTEDITMQNARYMSRHLKQYGWEYVVVDIRWCANHPSKGGGWYNQDNNPECQIDKFGRYVPSPTRFPSAIVDGKNAGFKALADSIHALGLKFGIHIMRGLPKYILDNPTAYALKGKPQITGQHWDMVYASTKPECPWLSDNLTVKNNAYGQLYYNSIVDLYASWGVDFIKVDDISRPFYTDEIRMLRQAIDQCGRPIVLSISPGKTQERYAASCLEMANTWRMMDDLWDRWNDVQAVFAEADMWSKYQQPGNYADCDILPLGTIDITVPDPGYCGGGQGRKTNLTADEQQTMMTLWGICHSPLMFGGELTKLDAATRRLLTNEEYLHMHRASTGNRQLSRTQGRITWTATEPETGDRYLALFKVDAGAEGWVYADAALWCSDLIAYTTTGHCEDCDIALPEGTTELALVWDDGGDNYSYDHGDFLNPVFVLADGTEVPATMAMKKSQYTASFFNRIYEDKNVDHGGKMAVLGTAYDHGFSADADAMLLLRVPEGAVRFRARAAIDDSGVGQANSTTSMRFMVFNGDPRTTVENSKYAKDDSNTFTVDLTELGYAPTDSVSFYNIWTKRDEGTFAGSSFSATLRSHASRLYRLSRVPEADAVTAPEAHESSEGDVADAPTYDLSGRRVPSLTTGLVIKNGHTMLVR